MFVLQLSTEGYVSFGAPLPSDTEKSIPVSSADNPIIAPYWSRYYTIGATESYYRVSDDQKTLDEVSAIMLKHNFELADFQPRMALVATLFTNSYYVSAKLVLQSWFLRC